MPTARTSPTPRRDARGPTRVLPGDPRSHAPTPSRPLRSRVMALAADTEVQPHRHAWAQVAMSDNGVIRMTAQHSTYLVPPTRALWIPPGIEHAVAAVEDAEIRTLYIHPSARFLRGTPRDATPFAVWPECRVLEVSPLLRELVQHLDTAPGARTASAREESLAALVLDELRRAAPVRLGIELPRERRLRRLCEAVLSDPLRHATLPAWSREAGASARTMARLFRQQLGTTFGEWRRQVRLAKALSLAGSRRPMNHIASELGYASPSAFSAMVRRTVGAPPRRFLAVDAAAVR